MSKQILVTTALPYANGPIHLGHLVEYIQADIWVRAQKMDNKNITFVCADDAHGTAIMLKAEDEGISPESLIEKVKIEHLADFKDFGIEFDNYHSTHSSENQFFSGYIFQQLQKAGLIESREIEQYFDSEKNIFLPDRFIKGKCPKCKSPDQYGDSCEVCSAAYSPTQLINPYSTISKSKPILKKSEHYFFLLSSEKCKSFLRQWTRAGHLQPEAANKVNEWLAENKNQSAVEHELTDWDISRDAPYFGFQIPNTKDKYFYVWLDAPIGYIASYANFLINQNQIKLNESQQLIQVVAKIFSEKAEASSELYHFIGKDILYFHALFWPAMLKFAGFRTPSALFVHGFLTINGQKMSKSRGTFITAREYLNCGINHEYLRYYFASRLNPNIEDLDLNLEEFLLKINSDLVGKTVNIASRAVSFIHKKFKGKIIDKDIAKEFYSSLPVFKDLSLRVRECYLNREYSKAIRIIMQAADSANQYFDQNRPWELVKNSEQQEKLHLICSILINAFKFIILCLKPVMPIFVDNSQRFLNINYLKWEDEAKLLPPNHYINPYTHLLTRIDKKVIDNLISPENQLKIKKDKNDLAENLISIEDLLKIDLRVAVVENATEIEDSEKIIKLVVNLGSKADGKIDRREILAGIKPYYRAEQLINKKIIVVANLAPRKMRYGVSQGMILAASNDDNANGIFIIEPEGGALSPAEIGMKVK